MIPIRSDGQHPAPQRSDPAGHRHVQVVESYSSPPRQGLAPQIPSIAQKTSPAFGLVHVQPSPGFRSQPLLIGQGGRQCSPQQLNPSWHREPQTQKPVGVSQSGPSHAGQSGMLSLQRSGLTQRPFTLHT
jgi:hypothetical protein